MENCLEIVGKSCEPPLNNYIPMSRNFYVRKHVNFTRVNKIEASKLMYARSRVNVRVELRSTSTSTCAVFMQCLYFIYAHKIRKLRDGGNPL